MVVSICYLKEGMKTPKKQGRWRTGRRTRKEDEMKRSSWIFIFFGCVFMAIFVLGQAQRVLPVSSNAAVNRQIVNREFDDMKLEIARLKAEVEKLTNVIKIYGSAVEIEASAITLDGTLHVRSRSYFYNQAYSYYSTIFTMLK